jgi:hypothetical protein
LESNLSTETSGTIEAWVVAAREKLRAGTLAEGDLDALLSVAASDAKAQRQRLLYLHAREPSVTSAVVGWAEHPGEDPGGVKPVPPYNSVLEALADGWQAIHFPQQLAPFDDRETDLVGYEFILQKMEPVSAAPASQNGAKP